jgi:hypothetical protein
VVLVAAEDKNLKLFLKFQIWKQVHFSVKFL